MANIFVNIVILSFILVKDGGAKLWLVLSAIYMFVFLTNEHIGELCFFRDCEIQCLDSIANFGVGNMLRHWGVTFIETLSEEALDGSSYAFLNKKNEDTYVD